MATSARSLKDLKLNETEVLCRFPSILTRDFQLRFFDAVFPVGQHVTSGIIEAVPGAGKTSAMVSIAFAAIVHCVWYGLARPHRVFVFVVDTMTAHGFAEEWRKFDGGDTLTVIHESSNIDFNSFNDGVIIMTYAWGFRNKEKLEEARAQVVILDEVHRAIAEKWKESWSVVRDSSGKIPLRIGATATLKRADDNVNLLISDPENAYYVGPVLARLNMEEALKREYVSPVELHEYICKPPPHMTKRTERIAFKARFLEDLLMPFLEGEESVTAAVFISDPRAAASFARRLTNEAGQSCFYISSEVDADERNQILEYLNTGRCVSRPQWDGRPCVLFSTVGQEGMNLTRCTCVIHFHANITSESQDAQRAGRAARKKARAQPSTCYVLLLPEEFKDREKEDARGYTEEIFLTKWNVHRTPTCLRAKKYVNEQSEEFLALVKTQEGVADGLVTSQLQDARAKMTSASASKKQKTVQNNLLTKFRQLSKKKSR